MLNLIIMIDNDNYFLLDNDTGEIYAEGVEKINIALNILNCADARYTIRVGVRP